MITGWEGHSKLERAESTDPKMGMIVLKPEISKASLTAPFKEAKRSLPCFSLSLLTTTRMLLSPALLM